MQWLLSLMLLAALADDARFVDATARMKKLDYEGALADFDKLLAEPHADMEHTELLLWSGAARALLGDEGGARLAFDAALRIDPAARITFKTSPKVLEIFEAVRAAQPPPPPAPAPASPPHVVEAAPSPSSTSPSSTSSPAAPAPTHESAGGPGLGAVVGIGAGVVGAACGVASVAFALDVQQRMAIANDPKTSQLDAQNLVDRANASLAAASVLGAMAIAGVGVGIASFIWPAEESK